MSNQVFWLHEDEWGMITLLPAENLDNSKHIAREASEFGQLHFGRELYIIPESRYPLVARQIPLTFLRTLVKDHLPEMDRVESGIVPGEIYSSTGFAFGDEHLGALYGNQNDDVIEHLHLIPSEGAVDELRRFWLETLTTLGTSYQLILADWWGKVMIDLQDNTMLGSYLNQHFG